MKFLEKKINVCVLTPGILRSYEHLSMINQLKHESSKHNVELSFVGAVYDFLGNPKHYKEKIKYDLSNKEMIDKSHVMSVLSKVIFLSTFPEKDRFGYDGRIISQWLAVKKSFDLMLNFEDKKKRQFDVIIRSRLDLKIDSRLFFQAIRLCKNNVVVSLTANKLFNDQLIVGTRNLMNKILDLSNFYYIYCNSDTFKKLHEKHHSNENLPDQSRNLYIGGLSERLFYHHICCVLDIDKEIATTQKFWKILRI